MNFKITISIFSFFILHGNLASGDWREDAEPKVKLDHEPEDTIVFSGNATHLNYFDLIVRDGKNLLLGARNTMYNLTASGLKVNHVLKWHSSEFDVQMCLTKGQSADYCQNFIKVISIASPGKIFICGTNAYRPRCRYYHLSATGQYMQSGGEQTGQGVCPYDPRHNSTVTVADGEIYAGTVADFAGIDPLIFRYGTLRTNQHDLKSLNTPSFVSSMAYEEFVFFFFRETSEEYKNCGKAIYSRVGRVCKSDRGYGRGLSKNRWTTYFKARLNCSIPGDIPFYYNELQTTSPLLPKSELGEDVIYGIFNTPENSITGSAVCAFKMRDVLDVFDGSFKGQKNSDSHWLPIPSSEVPDPRPGVCVNDSTTLPDKHNIFVNEHKLMDEAVQPVTGRPVFTQSNKPYRLTAMEVVPLSPGNDGSSFDILYLGTDDGKVLMVVNFGDKEPVISQEIQVFNSPVKKMAYLGGNPPRLLVGNNDNIKLINVRQCFSSQLHMCSDCVALQNPFCGWHKTERKCVAVPYDKQIAMRDYVQNLTSGEHPDCPPPPSAKTTDNTLSPNSQNTPSKSVDTHAGQTIYRDEVQDVDEGPIIVGTRRETYTAETLSIAVGVGCVLAVLLGFIVGWGCARRCRKDHDNIPYPDTDYEYFEQRHNPNINTRLVGEGKEEATYAEPVLDAKNGSAMPQPALQPDHHQDAGMFHFAQPYARELYRFEGDLASRGRPDALGSLRPGAGFPLDGYGTAHRLQGQNKPGLPMNDGYGTARSVKKVYL